MKDPCFYRTIVWPDDPLAVPVSTYMICPTCRNMSSLVRLTKNYAAIEITSYHRSSVRTPSQSCMYCHQLAVSGSKRTPSLPWIKKGCAFAEKEGVPPEHDSGVSIPDDPVENAPRAMEDDARECSLPVALVSREEAEADHQHAAATVAEPRRVGSCH
jgi:hypothetical protein